MNLIYIALVDQVRVFLLLTGLKTLFRDRPGKKTRKFRRTIMCIIVQAAHAQRATQLL